MQRSVLFFFLLLAVMPAIAAPKNYGTITTRNGKSFYDCKIMRVQPDGVSFTHRDGAAKIAFKDLPANMRQEFRYDPQQEAAYQREQADARKAELKRQQQQEIVMQERLMEARMAEASYLAAAQIVYHAPSTPAMSLALPGESLPKVGYQTPSWVGTPITGPAIGGSSYRSGNFSHWGYPAAYGRGSFPVGGYYPGYNYGYPYGGYSYGGYPSSGYYGGGYVPVYGPTVYRNWNVGHGINFGVGIGSFGTMLGICR